MEGIDNLPDEILEDLKQKAIERTGDDSDNIENNIEEELLDTPEKQDGESVPIVEDAPVKQVRKPKKERSEKQKAAFEKARKTRAENLKIKKQLEAEKKEQKQREKQEIKKQVKQRVEEQKAPRSSPTGTAPTVPVSRVRFEDDQPRYREQVVNNYYYYGHPPPSASGEGEEEPPPVKKRGRKKKAPPPPPVESSSSEEDEEEIIYDYGEVEDPQSYKELQNYTEEIERVDTRETAHPKLKFRFA